MYMDKLESNGQLTNYSTRQKQIPINGPFNGAPVLIQAPCTPRSATVQAPFVFLCGLPVFCTAEFLARAKLKSKAKKTTEKLGSMQKNN